MSVQPSYLGYVLEQLAALSALRSNRMFGAIGLYSGGIFFGLIDDDTLFFKTDDSNIGAYRERNMPRFMPFPDRPEAVLGYHQVPVDVIEDAETLVTWARQSIQVQLALQAAKPKRAAKTKTKPKPKAEVASKVTGKSEVRPAKRAKATPKKKTTKKPKKKVTLRKRARR